MWKIENVVVFSLNVAMDSSVPPSWQKSMLRVAKHLYICCSLIFYDLLIYLAKQITNIIASS